MFVHDFNCAWLEVPFFQRSLMIKDDHMVEKVVKQGIHEVYIDTKKGLDLSDGVPEEEVKKSIQENIQKIVEQTKPSAMPGFDFSKTVDIKDEVPLKEELKRAKVIKEEANRVVTDLMNDVRLGKQVETEKATHVVGGMVNSVLNNKHALMSLSRIKQKDEYTFMHSISVCVLLISYCKTIGLDRVTMNQVGIGGLLHDIGKMKVSQEILNKADELSDDEFEEMKRHVPEGTKLLEQMPDIPSPALIVASQHHERWNGSGYPNGLKGDEISLFGQMSAIVDVYDAITSNRVYHKRIEPGDALKNIYEWRGRHFNNDIVQNYIRCVGIYPIGTLIRTESGYLGIVIEQGQKDMLRPRVRLIFNIKKDVFINPKDIGLESADGGADSIVTSESPEKWKINPMMYMEIHT